MPTPAYITIEGATQGPITQSALTEDSVGNIWQEGHEAEILVQAIEHVVSIPRDPQSGQPSGQRMHKPLKFVAALNKATLLLYNALTSGEMLTKTEIKWYRTNSSGKQEHFFTTALGDATAVDIECNMPHVQDPKKPSSPSSWPFRSPIARSAGNTRLPAPLGPTTGVLRRSKSHL